MNENLNTHFELHHYNSSCKNDDDIYSIRVGEISAYSSTQTAQTLLL